MKDLMEYNGIIESTGSPREVLKNAFQNGIIEDGEEVLIEAMPDGGKYGIYYSFN